MLTILILFGIGAYIMVFDLGSVPRDGYEIANDPDRFWEINIGNGFVSNIENILMWLGEFFGFMRCLDLIKLIHEEDKKQKWRIFFERCEKI